MGSIKNIKSERNMMLFWSNNDKVYLHGKGKQKGIVYVCRINKY